MRANRLVVFPGDSASVNKGENGREQLGWKSCQGAERAPSSKEETKRGSGLAGGASSFFGSR